MTCLFKPVRNSKASSANVKVRQDTASCIMVSYSVQMFNDTSTHEQPYINVDIL